MIRLGWQRGPNAWPGPIYGLTFPAIIDSLETRRTAKGREFVVVGLENGQHWRLWKFWRLFVAIRHA